MSKIMLIINLLKLYFSLIFFDIQLTLRGFQYVFPKYIENYPINQSRLIAISNYDAFNREASDFLRLIDIACAYYPREAKCLHRSFLAFKILRNRFGIPVELIIGVKKFPFLVHAWLTCNGNNVNESEEYTSQFSIILRSGS